jgi:hypothetical protein
MQGACVVLSSVVCVVPPHFSTLPHKGHDFRGEKKVVEREILVLIFSTNFI